MSGNGNGLDAARGLFVGGRQGALRGVRQDAAGRCKQGLHESQEEGIATG